MRDSLGSRAGTLLDARSTRVRGVSTFRRQRTHSFNTSRCTDIWRRMYGFADSNRLAVHDGRRVRFEPIPPPFAAPRSA